MDRDSESKKYHRNSKRYLDQTSHTYSINPSSGLYEPNPQKEAQEVSENRRVQIEENPLPIQSRRDWKDFFDIIASGTGLLIASVGILISFFTAILLFFTVIFARKQWTEMHRTTIQSIRSADASNEAAQQAKVAIFQSKHQFIQDERPYLWTIEDRDHPEGPLHVNLEEGEYNNKIAFRYWIKNYGKSPALKVRSESYISFNRIDPEDDIQWKGFPDRSGIYAPGDSYFKTAFSKELADASTAQALRERPAKNLPPIAIHVRIEYFDQSGNRYMTELCMVTQPNGVIANCKKHNNL
jgi:hypothetical protein